MPRPKQMFSNSQAIEFQRFMKDSGLSARAIGRELKVQPSAVSRWANGEIRMSAERVIHICLLAHTKQIPLPNPYSLLAGPNAAKLFAVCQDWQNQ